MFRAYSKYFTFKGRAPRSEFWLFILWCFIATSIGLAIDYLALGWAEKFELYGMYGPASWAVIAFNTIPSVSVTVRRLHDRDKSGWFYWLSLIPLVGAIILLVWFCKSGTAGPNRFGPSPFGTAGRGHATDATSTSDDMLGRLEKLGQLREQGILTEDEFAVQKAAALRG